MRVSLRLLYPSENEFGNGRGTLEFEKRDVLLGGYTVVSPKDAGERDQSQYYDVVIETPQGVRYALGVVLEEGDDPPIPEESARRMIADLDEHGIPREVI